MATAHHRRNSLAAGFTWVSAHAMRNVLCPRYQAWPPGAPLPTLLPGGYGWKEGLSGDW